MQDFVPVIVDRDTEEHINNLYKDTGTFVPRTLFLHPDGTLEKSLKANAGEHAYYVDYDSAQNLRDLLKEAHQKFDLDKG